MRQRWSYFAIRLAERMFWTLAETAIALAGVELVNVPTAWVPVVATALAFFKGIVAKHIGDPTSPATLPCGI